GRRDGVDLFGVFRGPGRHDVELPRVARNDRRARAVRFVLHRSWLALFSHAGGGRPGGQEAVDPGGPGAEATGHPAHSVVHARGPGPDGACVPEAATTAAARV